VFERLLTNLQNVFKIPELRQRILFTLGMLAVYRVAAHVPTPGINGEQLSNFLHQQGGALMGFLDMFSGGALAKVTIVALGIMPYISASIILQLLTVVVPTLTKLAKEGERGRKKIIQYTRYGTIVIGLVQSFGIAVGLEKMNGGAFVQHPGWSFRLMTMITITAGTAFLMWLGEQITERGIGNGISLIIFSGIVANVPNAMIKTYSLWDTGQLNSLFLLALAFMMVGVTAAIVFLESGRRKIPVQYAKRVVGRKVYGGQNTHIPLKINTAGVIPPIFASSLLLAPASVAQWFGQSHGMEWLQEVALVLSPGQPLYILMFGAGIVFFAFFYTAIVFDPKDVADNLRRQGAYVPGIRPGQHTAKYIDDVITRLTLFGALYVTLVCLLPEFMIVFFNVTFQLGGTALLIVVVVAMDFMSQIQSHLMSSQYAKLMEKSNLKNYGRGGRR
jgi:preprotein translocase subunit SecY